MQAIELRLPLVDYTISLFDKTDFSKIKIIGVQHILETLHAMFRSFYPLGLKPENIALIGKCYSTCKEVYNEMLAEGMQIDPNSLFYSSHIAFDDMFSRKIQNFILSQIEDLKSGKYKKIIILDDGGHCINFLQKYFSDSKIPIVGIEQTSSGYTAIRSKQLHFPVINIARSSTKLNIESPMIAHAAITRLYKSLQKFQLFPQKALIIGRGPIGLAMEKKLKADMHVAVYDQNHDISDFDTKNLTTIIPHFPLIIGCTGTTSVPCKYHDRLSPTTTLVSVSSSDREFDAVHLRKQLQENNNCYTDLLLNSQKLLLINSGFPVNFDGNRENIDPNFIQLTLALIAGGILQANSLETRITPQILPLPFSTEKKIEQKFLSYSLNNH